jgi:hypothetical protein
MRTWPCRPRQTLCRGPRQALPPPPRTPRARLHATARPQPPQLSPGQLDHALQRMRLACRALRSPPGAAELSFLQAVTQEAFEQLLGSLAPDPADFRPGRLRAHLGVWRAYLCEEVCGGSPLPPELASALSLVGDGVRFDFVPVGSEPQRAAPRQKGNLRIVEGSLARRYPSCPPADRLPGSRTPRTSVTTAARC